MGNIVDLAEKKEPVNIKGERATFENEKYGSHPLNVFDIWLAESEVPTPLVIYIHGGGFVGGDKSKYFESEDMVRFLAAGVSVATINYRFMTDAPFGIKASFFDSKRCLQYIRHNAKKYNIDKTRIACSGGSAGAGTALWLAFSDDMADPQNEDPVLRESSRLTCAGAFATQSTYDIFQWEKIIGIPISDTPEQLWNIATAFGLKDFNGVDLYNQKEIRKDLDFLSRMDKSDPPIFVYNRHKSGIPTNEDELNHHPLHAKAIKEKADAVGLEAIVYAPEIGIVDPSGKDLVDFFMEKFFE
ncbi:alpha/beta hydrolase fold [Mariniphaga anaerophila]|uniref:Alpha/beta hydrolase fold n=1 Tax=Mariniphaga anaerophila TaxID=1484053 RepID=A0A1M4YCM8_9BACT|nr:alpha/beta hydrolase [Mariniphaga anaerophila]SHF03333.1 alpha/beta hydrolase fold [Mariniphaga anaerophila]